MSRLNGFIASGWCWVAIAVLVALNTCLAVDACRDHKRLTEPQCHSLLGCDGGKE